MPAMDGTGFSSEPAPPGTGARTRFLALTPGVLSAVAGGITVVGMCLFIGGLFLGMHWQWQTTAASTFPSAEPSDRRTEAAPAGVAPATSYPAGVAPATSYPAGVAPATSYPAGTLPAAGPSPADAPGLGGDDRTPDGMASAARPFGGRLSDPGVDIGRPGHSERAIGGFRPTEPESALGGDSGGGDSGDVDPAAADLIPTPRTAPAPRNWSPVEALAAIPFHPEYGTPVDAVEDPGPSPATTLSAAARGRLAPRALIGALPEFRSRTVVPPPVPADAADPIKVTDPMHVMDPTGADTETSVALQVPGSDGSVPSGRFAVQVGAFGQPDNAEGLGRRLAEEGFSTRVLPRPARNGTTLYRVQVGRYAAQADAERVVGALRRQGVDAIVVAAD